MLLDIVFNTGTVEYTGESTSYFWNILLPVIITVIGTVILTMIGQRYYENYKRNESLDELYDQTKQQIESFIIAASQFFDNVMSAQTVIEKKEIDAPTFTLVSDFDVELIIGFNMLDLYHSIVSRRFNNDVQKQALSKLYTELKSSLNHCSKNEDSIIKAFADYNDKSLKHQSSFSESSTSYQNLLKAYIGTITTGDKLIEELYTVLVTGSKEFTLTEKSNTYYNVVLPSLAICHKYASDEKVYLLRHHLAKMDFSFFELVTLKAVYADFFKKAADKLVIVKNKIVESVIAIDVYKPKTMWQFYTVQNF